jgi:hypothetical protein
MQRHVGSYAQAPGCVCWQVEYGGRDRRERARTPGGIQLHHGGFQLPQGPDLYS